MQKRFLSFMFLGVLLALTLLAGSTVLAQDALPTWSDLAAGEWTEIAPGGDTACAYGTDFRFYVRPAAEPTDKLIIYFAGGGACWDKETCAPSFAGPDGSPLFVSAAPEGSSAALTGGFFNYDNEANPVADYNAVYVPVCTADIHTGDAVIDYENAAGEKYTMYHKGFVNATAAIDWTVENVAAPTDVVMAGCSAGAYGSIFHAPRVIDTYTDARVVQLGDAGVGVLPAGENPLVSWGFGPNIPLADTLALEDPADFSIRDLYKASAQTYPDATFSEVTSYLDNVQIGFYYFLGGGATPEEAGANWLLGMRSNLSGLSGSLSNFRSLMYGGNLHCITPRDELYTTAVDGQPVVDWVANLVSGETPRTLNCSNCNTAETISGE